MNPSVSFSDAAAPTERVQSVGATVATAAVCTNERRESIADLGEK
jgi:hypothetical protein